MTVWLPTVVVLAGKSTRLANTLADDSVSLVTAERHV